jgi:putative addiction module CopG family antidote
MMTIDLTPEMQTLIDHQLAAGRYATAAEVVYSALWFLHHASNFQQEILASMADEEAGRTMSFEDFDAKFRSKYLPPATP